MRTRWLGKTDVQVSEIGFGSAGIGNLYQAVDDGTARDAVDAAWDAGVRYFDTAPHYGLGLAERRLGAALAGRPRDEFVVSTKVGRLLQPNPRPVGSDLGVGLFDVPDDLTRLRDYSADGVRRSLDASLERLGTDRVDIVLVHDPDDAVEQTMREAIPALVALRDQGVVGAVGVGMNQWQTLARMVRAQIGLDVVMLAGRWTLLDRSGSALMDDCALAGVSVLAAAPYNSGLLAADRPRPGATFDYAVADEETVRRVDAMADAATGHGVVLPALAVQFPLRHRATASVVIGLRNRDEVAAAAHRHGASVTAAAWAAVEKARTTS